MADKRTEREPCVFFADREVSVERVEAADSKDDWHQDLLQDLLIRLSL